MSAAEKLQALYDDHARALEDDSGTLEPYKVYDALPQIIAVVEAAEQPVERFDDERVWAVYHDVLRALAALDEKLRPST